MEFSEIIAYLGGWTVLTVSIAVFIGKFFAERTADKLKIEWGGKQEEKLEQLRAEITREHSIFTAILNSYSSSHHFSQSNRIKAVQSLWGSTLEIRKMGEIPSFFFEILLEHEYNTVYDNENIMGNLNSLSFDNTIGKTYQIVEIAEKSRPFLGEHLWSLFKLYTILVGRVSWLLMEGKNKRDIKSWHKDEHTQSIINEIFDEKEILGSFKKTTELLEQKILFEMFKIISGELAAESDLSKVSKLHKLIAEDEIYMDKAKQF